MQVSAHRVEFFSDSVISIAITLLVFEMKIPNLKEMGDLTQWEMFAAVFPTAFIYLLTFLMLAIAWAGHHEMFLKVTSSDPTLLWLNMMLLFWLTLLPNAAYMMGRHPNFSATVSTYGFNMFMLSASFILCRSHIMKHHMLVSKNEELNNLAYAMARNKHRRSFVGLGVYGLSICFAFVYIPLSYFCFILPAMLYAIPGNVSGSKFSKTLLGIFQKPAAS